MKIFFYKVLRDFDYKGKTLTAGEEIFLPEREGEKLLKEGSVTQGRFLDPSNGDDKKRIEQAEAEHDAEYEVAKKKDEERDEKKEEEHAADDEKRAELLDEAEEIVGLIEDETGEEISAGFKKKALSRAETNVIEQAVEKLRAVKNSIDAGEDTDLSEITDGGGTESKEEEEEKEEEETPKKKKGFFGKGK